MFKYFTLEEFACQETGENGIKEEFVTSLDALRDECGFPFSSFVDNIETENYCRCNEDDD